MLFHQFTTEGLAHYSYAVGCQQAGSMAIVDPRRDIEIYLGFAKTHNLRITHVLETHIHADYASGAKALAAATQAILCLSAYDKNEDYVVQFPHQSLEHQQHVQLGNIRIQALHTPGHTPEHISFLVYDESRSRTLPLLLLSGDFLLIGSLGRPDLLGEAAKVSLAKKLYASVQALKSLPDSLEIYPAHGAGSMCGAGMSARPLSTLGYERQTNPYLAADLQEAAFVTQILNSVPPFPPYYRRMKQLNSQGPAILPAKHGQAPLALAAWQKLLAEGAVVVDFRDIQEFSQGHIAGAVHVGFAENISTWAAWVLPYATTLLLVTNRPEQIPWITARLVRVGLDAIAGYLEGGMPTWMNAQLPVQSLEQITASELATALKQEEITTLIDVRTKQEWQAAHIAQAQHVSLGDLVQQLEMFSKQAQPMAVICGSGYRSSIAASLLQQQGVVQVKNVSGGMQAWLAQQLPSMKG